LGASPVNRKASFGTPMNVVKGDEVVRLQLSQ
jgi:hypothetical protein